MIWDHARKDGPGAYGEGLAAPLGEMRWLDDMRGPVTFRWLHVGEHGDLRFPYHLLKHQVGAQIGMNLFPVCRICMATDSAAYSLCSLLLIPYHH